MIDHEKMVEFVKDFFESHDPIGTDLAHRYPFRRRFGHCLRCTKRARRISIAEGADGEIVMISALFHDIGKAVSGSGQDHGEIGAKICDEYLASIGYNAERRARIVRIVRDHSKHADDDNTSLEEKVVSDADLLDEVGAISVLWDSMACAGEDEPSYIEPYNRIARTFFHLRGTFSKRLHTQNAQYILKERLSFLQNFLWELDYELGKSEEI